MMKQRLYHILRAPHVSEKTTRVGEDANQYVFEVAADASKPEIRDAVEQLFDVKVEGVQVVNAKGKPKGFRMVQGRRSGWRKAYVRLAAGQTIDVLSPS